jgi:hypothetical protein
MYSNNVLKFAQQASADGTGSQEGLEKLKHRAKRIMVRAKRELATKKVEEKEIGRAHV